jgi:DNA-binding MarR family transcriptional regulator
MPAPRVEDVAAALRLSVARLTRRLRSLSDNDSVPLSLLSAMAALAREGPLTPTELAGNQRVGRPTITRVIRALERAGWLHRQGHPDDRRQCLVDLTPLGHDLLAAEISIRDRWLRARLGELTDADRTVLAEAIRILDKVTEM